MTATAIPTETWQFDGRRATLACGTLQGVVDVSAPRGGIGGLTFNGTALNGSLLAVDVDGEASDAYVRCEDLVVTYRETPERPFSVQVYWSVTAGEGGELILDATISIQTRAWETYPRVTVASTLTGADVVRCVEDGVALSRLADANWTYAEAALPEDFVLASAADPTGDGTAWSFAEQFMERGVIRRRRVRGAFVRRDGDLVAARRLFAALGAEQPPLTA